MKATLVLLLLTVCAAAQTVTTMSPVPQRPTTIVGSLPTCVAALRGQMYIVTDALAPVAITAVSNGGAVVIGVTCNGSAWIVE